MRRFYLLNNNHSTLYQIEDILRHAFESHEFKLHPGDASVSVWQLHFVLKYSEKKFDEEYHLQHKIK